MNYAEAAYFDNNACQHVATWKELLVRRERRIRMEREYRGIERRRVNGTN